MRSLKLNDEWRIGEPIYGANEQHATVYSVLISETGQLAQDLEAHIFFLNDIEPKTRKHRRRCIRRMEGRTKLKVEIDNATIVVITTSREKSAGVLERGEESQCLDKGGPYETAGRTTTMGKAKQKTLYQRELQRMQQRERRQAERRSKGEQSGEGTAKGKQNIGQEIRSEDSLDGKGDASMFDSLEHEVHHLCDMFESLAEELLHLWDLCEETAAIHTTLAQNKQGRRPYEMLDQYLSHNAAALKNIEELESHLKTRRSEIISSQRDRSRVLYEASGKLAKKQDKAVERKA